MDKHSIIHRIMETKVVAVIRGQDAGEAVKLSKAAVDGGVRAIELTYTTPGIEEAFQRIAEYECTFRSRLGTGF